MIAQAQSKEIQLYFHVWVFIQASPECLAICQFMHSRHRGGQNSVTVFRLFSMFTNQPIDPLMEKVINP